MREGSKDRYRERERERHKERERQTGTRERRGRGRVMGERERCRKERGGTEIGKSVGIQAQGGREGRGVVGREVELTVQCS